MRAVTGVLAGLVLVALLAVFVLVVDTRQRSEDASDRSSSVIPSRAEPDVPRPVLPGALTTEPSDAHAPTIAPEAEAPRKLATLDPLLATVIGRVIDAARAPLGGVEITLSPEDFLPRNAAETADPLRFSVTSRDTTALDGSFRLAQPAASKLILSLKRPDGTGELAGEIALLPGVTLDLGELVLPAARSFTGRVQDPAGRPIAGADVLCSDGASFLRAASWQALSPAAAALRDGVVPDEKWIQSFASELQQSVRTTSADDGSFTAALVAPRNAELFVAAGAAGWSVEWLAPSVDPRDRPLVLTLRPTTARVAGRVTCIDHGAVPAGTLVEAKSAGAAGVRSFGRAAKVAPDGSFEIAGLLDAPQQLVAVAPDRGLSPPVLVAPGTRDARLVLGPTSHLTLHVVRDGRPLDAFEALVDSKPTWSRDETPHWERHAAGPHAEGTLQLFGLPLGRLTVQALADDDCSEPVTLDLDAGHPAQEVELRMGAGRMVRGTVIDRASGLDVAGAEVRVHGTGSTLRIRSGAVTSADGRFAVGPLPDVPLQVRVEAPAHVTVELPVPADPAAPLVVALERGTLVRIRVGPVLAAALRAGTLSLDDNKDDVRVVAMDHSDGTPHRLGLAGVLLDDLAPGTWRVELLRTGDPQAKYFTAVAGELVTVDY